MLYLGIDPGVTGACALIDETGKHRFSWRWDKKLGLRGLKDQWRTEGITQYMITAACLEKVHSMPGQGVSSTFKFGMNFGMWQGLLVTADIRHELITPQRWMKAVLDSGDRSPEHRLAWACRRWPEAPWKGVKVESGIADALGLAEYARQTDKEPF